MKVNSTSPIEYFTDAFGNLAGRFTSEAGRLELSSTTVIRDTGEPDRVGANVAEVAVENVPPDVLQYLLNSRYCEVDLLSAAAWELFGGLKPGAERVEAICAWVKNRTRFDYGAARPTKSAVNVFTEATGVCRDFQHLAISLCRALHMPARYVTGYLGDICAPAAPYPMDFNAWFEVYLESGWRTFDARHNTPRVGRVPIAVGRDATDVAITTSFGSADLSRFRIITEEIT